MIIDLILFVVGIILIMWVAFIFIGLAVFWIIGDRK